MTVENPDYVEQMEATYADLAERVGNAASEAAWQNNEPRVVGQAVLDLVLPMIKERDRMIRHYEIICARYALKLQSAADELSANIVHRP